MDIHTVIELRNGLLISAESFENKADARDHFIGVCRGRGTMQPTDIDHGTFAMVNGSAIDKEHTVYLAVSSL